MTSPIKYPYEMSHFLIYLLKSRGYTEWGNDETDYTREFWGHRKMWMLRPRFDGFIKRLPCGCSKRFGKFLYYRWRCVENHGNINKLLLERDKDGNS